MFRKHTFFEGICEEYYEKILRYLYGALGNETAARDCTQEVFLVACQKSALLQKHPNPGGFLFQTAKNLVRRFQRESFRRMIEDISLEGADESFPDSQSDILYEIDKEIDEFAYIEEVLSCIPQEKRELYTLYYMEHKTMAEIAEIYGVQEAAMRMRYVRLRREIRQLVAELAGKYFEI